MAEFEPSTESKKASSVGPLAKSYDRIILDVGGTLFHTTIDTLKDGSSYFNAMLSGSWGDLTVDKDGKHTCFVDADPETFVHILRHLRTGLMPLFWNQTAGFDFTLYSQVLDQARFFQIQTLINWIKKSEFRKAITISTTVRIEDDNEWDGDDKEIIVSKHPEKVEVRHDWTTVESYVCPRGISKHDGREWACGRACKSAQGDDPIQTKSSPYCKLFITAQTTTFNHEVLSEADQTVTKELPGRSWLGLA